MFLMFPSTFMSSTITFPACYKRPYIPAGNPDIQIWFEVNSFKKFSLEYSEKRIQLNFPGVPPNRTNQAMCLEPLVVSGCSQNVASNAENLEICLVHFDQIRLHPWFDVMSSTNSQLESSQDTKLKHLNNF